MDSRSDWFHGFKKKVLEGHRAMVPLGEDNEDAPYPSPRPITGLPEPIPGEPFWEKSYSGSASESSSDTEFVNESELSPQSEKNGESIQTTPEPKTGVDHCSEPSFGSTEEEFISYIGELKSDLADLQMEVKDLNKYINNLHSDHDDCMNRLIILQDSVERSDEYQDFYRKLFESTKYKGGNGIIQPTKREKQVRYHHGKRVQDDEPLVVDPFVKALVDKRLEPITRSSPDEYMGRVLDKGGVGKTEDRKGGCTVMDKTCDIMDKGEDNYTSEDNKNDDVGLSKIMDKLEKNSNMTNISSISTTTSSIDAHSTFGTYSTYNTTDGYAPCKFLEADSCQRERCADISKNKSLEDPKEITTELGQKNTQISNGGKCTSSHEVHPPTEQRPVLSASSSNATVIIMDEDNGGSENHKDVHLVNHSKLQGHPDVERILTEIQMINYLIENEEEDASAFVGNNKINSYSSTVKSFSYEDSLGKYQKLPAIGRVPHITLSDKYAENQPRISSSDKSTNSRDAPSMVTPKSTRSNTVNVPNSSINEKKNQNRLVNKLEPERLTADEKKSYIQPKIKLSSSNIKSTLPKIKSSSQNINTALPKIQSGKIKSFSGNNHFVLPKIKPSSENINSGNTNSTFPKIKTASAKDYIKGNNKMAMKIKTPVLPNIMKSIPTIPKVYKPTPPTVKPTKRPYTGKYRKLPPILDLNAELEKQNTFKDT